MFLAHQNSLDSLSISESPITSLFDDPGKTPEKASYGNHVKIFIAIFEKLEMDLRNETLKSLMFL